VLPGPKSLTHGRALCITRLTFRDKCAHPTNVSYRNPAEFSCLEHSHLLIHFPRHLEPGRSHRTSILPQCKSLLNSNLALLTELCQRCPQLGYLKIEAESWGTDSIDLDNAGEVTDDQLNKFCGSLKKVSTLGLHNVIDDVARFLKALKDYKDAIDHIKTLRLPMVQFRLLTLKQEDLYSMFPKLENLAVESMWSDIHPKTRYVFEGDGPGCLLKKPDNLESADRKHIECTPQVRR
jgi:hypothetical protein